MYNVKNLKEYHCKNCNKILFFGEIVEGKVSKDCPKCGERNIITVEKIVTSRLTIELVQKLITTLRD